jgi:hypothetical protein
VSSPLETMSPVRLHDPQALLDPGGASVGTRWEWVARKNHLTPGSYGRGRLEGRPTGKPSRRDRPVKPGPRPFHAGHSWLAAVVPSEASRFRVFDPDIADTLARAGAQLVDDDPDVEIGPVVHLSGEAPIVISNLGVSPASSRSRPRRIASRVRTHADVRTRSERARRALRRRGYSHIALLPWDRDQVLRLPNLARPTRISLAERFPCQVVLVGSRHPRGETAFEHAVSEAGKLVGFTLRPTWPLPRASGLVALCDEGVLRVATGPGGHQIDAQTHALQALAAASPSGPVAQRVSRILGEGRVGLTRWSFELRLPGVPAPPSIDPSLVESCVEFLVALHELGGDREADRGIEQAQILGCVLAPDKRKRLRELARRVDEALGEMPRGFAHGDFCTNNLLVHEGRLAGVVDWEAANSSCLPMVDLLHLLAAQRAGVYEWGPVIIEYLLPLMRRRGDTVIRDYLGRLGLDPDPPQLEALVAAYWLARASYQIGMYLDRGRDQVWIERNVTRVLETLAPA